FTLAVAPSTSTKSTPDVPGPLTPVRLHVGATPESSVADAETDTLTISPFTTEMLEGVAVTLLMTGGVVSFCFAGDMRNTVWTPFSVPSPTIWPDALIPLTSFNTHPELTGSSVLRSTAPLASVCISARMLPSASWYQPALTPPEIDSTFPNVEGSPASATTGWPGSQR